MRIVRAGLDHLDELSGLFDRYRQFYEQAADPAACKQFMQARLSQGESVVFLAESAGGEALGFTQLYHSFCSVELEKIVYLYDLYVAPQARRQGVAKALMEAARVHAVEQGAARLQLETAITNRAGQALYESLGWERDDEFLTYHLGLKE